MTKMSWDHLPHDIAMLVMSYIASAIYYDRDEEHVLSLAKNMRLVSKQFSYYFELCTSRLHHSILSEWKNGEYANLRVPTVQRIPELITRVKKDPDVKPWVMAIDSRLAMVARKKYIRLHSRDPARAVPRPMSFERSRTAVFSQCVESMEIRDKVHEFVAFLDLEYPLKNISILTLVPFNSLGIFNVRIHGA
tara:strand:- start:6446 stop:7021 length:576 start_codon:yes stop_codon:yes gene_type:complete